MRKQTMLMWIALTAVSALLYTGCQRSAAAGKLQIMYSGNIKGNVSPCG